MPGEAKPKGEVEVFFGIKQVLIVVAVLAAAVGVAYFTGFKAGYGRGLRSEPGLLSFLDNPAPRRPEPVKVPDVLLAPADPAASAAAESPVPASRESAPSAAGGDAPGRARPDPAVKRPPPASAPPSRAVSKPVPQAPRKTASAAAALHYQVAALSVSGNAKSLVDWLRREGFRAHIMPESNGLFRVYVGPFKNDAEAEAAKERLSQDGFNLMARRL